MKALEQASSEKQIECQKSRMRAREVWLELRELYNNIEPEAKQNSLTQLIGNQMANKLSKAREQQKVLRENQRRAVSNDGT